jgi:hypothetical protein
MKYMLILFAPVICSFIINHLQAQTAAVDNKVSQSITFRPIPKGPTVLGIFQGRFPCLDIARQLKISTNADCIKLKSSLILYQDPVTFHPTSYTLTIVGGGDVIQRDGNSFREKVLEGKWSIVKGIKSHPGKEIYQLEAGQQGAYFYLLKGDENVLFILDENKGFRVGNEDFSYTLNRVILVPGNK